MKRIANVSGKFSQHKMASAVLVLCATTAIALPAQTFTTLHSFHRTDGQEPYAGLIQATDGNLYGTTFDGGANGSAGTLFRISTSGALTTIYSFCSQPGCTDGNAPAAGVIQATDGNFYGTTYVGGTGTGPQGGGTVFKITPTGMLTTLYNFCSQTGCTDGGGPFAALVQATNGNFYGTTYTEGADFSGTLFEISRGDTLTTLHTFAGYPTDGANPGAALLQATDGSFYGTAGGGGTNGISDGTIFKLTSNGTLTTLYDFCSQSGCTDGQVPGGLIQASDGDFYGTTLLGGASGYGTVFRITPSGALTTLYSFCSQTGCTDGENPTGALVRVTDGNFYGTTQGGGVNGGGTVFKVTPSGALTTLYSFCSQSGCTDGLDPLGPLVQATNGKLYGTTNGGGTNGDGTVFSLALGLGPFVETQGTSGKVGGIVKILGNELTGTTSVSFNGTTAAFTVISPSLITTTVPAGATSGRVQVVTPSRTLSSNVPFRVLP